MCSIPFHSVSHGEWKRKEMLHNGDGDEDSPYMLSEKKKKKTEWKKHKPTNQKYFHYHQSKARNSEMNKLLQQKNIWTVQNEHMKTDYTELNRIPRGLYSSKAT